MSQPEPQPHLRCYHDGQILSGKEQEAAMLTLARFRGQGVFETLLALSGNPVAWQEHLHRLRRGADLLEVSWPGEHTIRHALLDTLASPDLQAAPRCRLRLSLVQQPDQSALLFVEASPYPDETRPASVISLPYCRNEKSAIAGIKSMNYGENVPATRLARDAGADEGLFANTAGELCEGTWSNVFVQTDEGLFTPPLSSGCLPGVTRHLVLHLAQKHGIPIEETAQPFSVLQTCSGAFLTTSLRGLQPISSIDGRTLDLAHFPRYATLRELYEAWLVEHSSKHPSSKHEK